MAVDPEDRTAMALSNFQGLPFQGKAPSGAIGLDNWDDWAAAAQLVLVNCVPKNPVHRRPLP